MFIARWRAPAAAIRHLTWWLSVLSAGLLLGDPNTARAWQPDEIPLPQVSVSSSASDSAAIALDVARDLQAVGERQAAEALLRRLIERYPGTAAAATADSLLGSLRADHATGRGDTQFIVWNTIFATWLGLAIPLAADSEEAAAYGAALLISPTVGFFASRAYTKSHPLTLGQSGAYLWSTVWISWQAIGWRAALDIGDQEECYDYGAGVECTSTAPENAATKAALVGGLLGIGGGLILANQDIRAGDATLVTHASLWGSVYGLCIGGLADLEDDGLLTSVLVGGNVGLLAGIPAARAWHPPRGRVWVVSAAGLAGGLAGLGVDLLVETDDDQVAIAIPTVTMTLGLLGGVVLTRNVTWTDEASSNPWSNSLLAFDSGPRLGLPLPSPGVSATLDREGRRHRVPVVEARLIQVGF